MACNVNKNKTLDAVQAQRWQDSKLCASGDAKAKWYVSDTGDMIWVPDSCRYRTFDKHRKATLAKQMAACAAQNDHKLRRIVLAGDSVMRRNWLYMVGAKKDTKMDYKGSYKRQFGDMSIEFRMLQRVTDASTQSTFQAILNDTSIDLLVFNVGMWDLVIPTK
jgi:hypothetical protein